MKRKTIENLLKEINSFCNLKTQEWIKDGTVFIHPNKISDIQIKSIDLSKYNKTGSYSSISTGGIYRTVIQPKNPVTNLPKKLISAFKKTKSYNKIINQKSLLNPIKEQLFNNFLLHYCHYLLIKEFDSNPDFKQELVDTLLVTLRVRKYKYIKYLYSQGLIIVEDEIKLKFETFLIRIRKPTVLEFAHHSRAYNSEQINCIVEIEYFDERPRIDFQYGEKILSTVLSIYSMSSFTINYSRKIIEFSDLIWDNKSTRLYKNRDTFKTKIFNTDKSKLQNFLNNFSDSISKIENEKNEKDTFIYSLKLAIEQYKDCLLNVKVGWKKRITQSIMGLESIWLTDNDKETIGYKLKIRTSKILIIMGLDKNEVPKNLGIAYSIRSSFAHGSPIKSELRKKITKGTIKTLELEKEILNYLRVSIVVGMMLIDRRKQDFVNSMTKSIYDESENKILNKELNNIKVVVKRSLPLTLKADRHGEA